MKSMASYVGMGVLQAVSLAAAPAHDSVSVAPGCKLNSADGRIKHVVYLQFDNVHLRRDNPNVPSDLEQIPNLLNFLQDNGTLLTNHHTPLISHTAVDIVTSLTGVYGEKFGFGVGNSFGYFFGVGIHFASSFTYWTDKLLDGTYEMIDQSGNNAPAPRRSPASRRRRSRAIPRAMLPTSPSKPRSPISPPDATPSPDR